MKQHLSREEFDGIRGHMVALRNGHIGGDELDKFTYDDVNYKFVCGDMVINIDQPVFRCEACELDWRVATLDDFKGKSKVLCPHCRKDQKLPKEKSIENIAGNKVTYRVHGELKFILWCKENGILIENGPCLEYEFQGGICEYVVPYYLPKHDVFVDFQDNHIQERMKSGLWQARFAVVADKNYMLIYPKKLSEYKKRIIKMFSM